jgi:transposase
MKSASNTPMTQLPETPPNDVTGGLDWSRDDHAVSVVDTRGREVLRHNVEHTAAGLAELIALLAAAGCGEIAIERPDGPVVDALLAAEMTVVVISPNQVKNLRGRYGSAGNKDDRFDAFVLADTLRTDRARLRALVPDTAPTVALRRACRARRDLVAHRVGAANQLRAHLRAVFPGAVGLFADIDSPISLTFLTRFTTQNQADWLSPTRLGKWLSGVGYCGKVDPAVLHARLVAAPRGLTGAHADAHAAITRAFVGVLTSLPRAGRVRAARLLAEIGDCRAKFPTPESLACLAGVAPSTRQSGKIRAVGFRWACDKHLRDAVCDFAGDSRRANPWAADLYTRARARGHDHPHAVRILARAWLTIIWHCWQDSVDYRPTTHGALQRLLHDQNPTA